MVKEETPVTSIQKLPDGFIEGEQGTYIHKHSGIEFPKNLDSFQRKYLTGFDPYGYHIAITYDNYTPLRAVMTIYVYPASLDYSRGDIDTEYEHIKKDLHQLNSNVNVFNEIDEKDFKMVVYQCTSTFDNIYQPVQRMIFLMMEKKWFIKTLVTYTEEHVAGTDTESLTKFIGDIPLLKPVLEPVDIQKTDFPCIITVDEEEQWFHPLSGIIFPKRLGLFQRWMPVIYDNTGKRVSFSYSTEKPALIDATIYLKPAKGEDGTEITLEEELRVTNQSIVTLFPDAQFSVEMQDVSDILHELHKGLASFCTHRTVFHDKKQTVASQTLVFKINEWFIKYRITYPAAEHTNNAAIDAIVDLIAEVLDLNV